MEKKSCNSVVSSLITYLILLLCFVCIRVLFLFIKLPFSDEVNNLIVTLFVQGILMTGFTVFMFTMLKKQKVKETFSNFGYHKVSFLPIIISILIGIVCYFLNLFISSFFSTIISLCGYENVPYFSFGAGNANYSLSSFFIQVCIVAFLPAIGEETAHRGLLLNGLSSIGIKKAVIISSVFFGLMHLNINQFFYATILGFLIALTAVISKSIFPAMIIHFMNNFLSLYFSFAEYNSWFGGGLKRGIANMIYGNGNIFSFFITSVLMLGCLFLALVVLFSILLNQTRVKKVKKMLVDISKIDESFNPNFSNQQNKDLINIQRINDMMKEYNIKSLNSMVFTDIESKGRKLEFIEKMLLVSICVLGGLITASTFIWGIL